MNELMSPRIKGSGFIEIDGEKIPFENKVSTLFSYGLQNYFDNQFRTSQYQIPYRNSPMSVFSLLEESAELKMDRVYTTLGDISIANMKIIRASLLKTVLQGSGTISKDGVIRSAGFNVVRKRPFLVTPSIASSYREVEVNLPSQISTLITGNWLYYKPKKCLYGFYSNQIAKIPYDVDTNVMGAQTIITTQWDDNTGISLTNGKDKIIRIKNRYSSEMKIFDIETETISTIPLSASLPYSQNDYSTMIWDDNIKGLRDLSVGLTISMTGVVTLNQPVIDAYSPIEVKSDYILCADSLIEFSSPRFMMADMNSSGYKVLKKNRLVDENGFCITVDFLPPFPSGKIRLYIQKEPETSLSILPISPKDVTVGTPFNIEYSFEVVR